MPRPPLTDRYQISWSEVINTPGRPGRKHQMIGRDAFPPGAVADLFVEAERKLLQGYRIEILPPSGPTVDSDPFSSCITVEAA